MFLFPMPFKYLSFLVRNFTSFPVRAFPKLSVANAFIDTKFCWHTFQDEDKYTVEFQFYDVSHVTLVVYLPVLSVAELRSEFHPVFVAQADVCWFNSTSTLFLLNL